MSRLYYDPPKHATVPYVPFQPKAVRGKQKANNYNYLEKVSRLIPAEVLAGYITIFGLADAVKNQHAQVIVHWVIWGVCLAVTPFYLSRMADKGKPKILHLILSTLAFVAWSYVTTGKTLQDSFSSDTYEPAIAAVSAGLFSLVLGIIPLNF